MPPPAGPRGASASEIDGPYDGVFVRDRLLHALRLLPPGVAITVTCRNSGQPTVMETEVDGIGVVVSLRADWARGYGRSTLSAGQRAALEATLQRSGSRIWLAMRDGDISIRTPTEGF